MKSGYTLVHDIEVAGLPWEEVDEITRGCAPAHERDAVPVRPALYPAPGKGIAIEERRPLPY